jgi:tRNA modification GTPase
MAEPGEFTRRAFEAGRLDLAKVEALGDLLAAETELQRRQAARGLGGALHRQTEAWREKLIRAAALVEVTIDWADEEVPEDVGPEVARLLAEVRGGIARELATSEGAERMRQGFEVAILGVPNAGKSSLFNALAGREAAIISAQPGTTRDVLELRYDLAGLPVVFLDTAGLRETSSEIEAIGVARAAERAGGAAMRLFLRSEDAPPPAAEDLLWRPGDLRIWTKGDIFQGPGDITISALRGDGVPEMLRRIRAELSNRHPVDGLVGHLRQRRALEEAAGALARAENELKGREVEAVAEDIRTTFRALERLIGRVGIEDVLGAVFASFCLGK